MPNDATRAGPADAGNKEGVGLYTEDSAFHGALRLRQHARGYRFSVDAILLGAYASAGRPVDVAADLGAGCGVAGLCLAHKGKARSVILLEVQAGLAALARHNAEQNGLSHRVLTLRANLRLSPLSPGSIDLVVCNPPYREAGSGAVPSDAERALARHEAIGSLESGAREAARCLSRASGRFFAVYPAVRLDDALDAVRAARLAPVRLRLVHPAASRRAELVLVEARPGASSGHLVVEPPLVSHDEQGRYTAEMEALLAGRF